MPEAPTSQESPKNHEGPRTWLKRERAAAPEGAQPPLALVVPLYDEEGNVAGVAEGVLEAFRLAGVPLTLVLVDNGSRDGTRAEVQALEARHPEVQGLYLDKNQGYGGGILAGMARAPAGAEVLGYLWGDGQVAAEDVVRIYRRLVAEGAEVCKARRVQRMDGWQRSVVTRVYNTVTLWLFHVDSPDANGCPKLFRRAAWERLAPTSKDWFLDPEIMIGAANAGMKLAEVDVVARARDFGVSKVGAGTILEFAWNLAKVRIRG